MGYLLGLGVALVIVWLGLSGHYEPLLLGLGGFSVLFCLWFAARLDLLDREASPYHRFFSLFGYWVWLMGEIIKANALVIRAIVQSEPDISPAMVKVRTTCRSDLARTIFANSITLTPGTVTVDVDGDMMLVHALIEETAGPGAFDEMDRRSAAATDGKG
ncbi:MAG: Na+/H+ antiporter subunit E [Pseudomonadota bacterium]